MEGGVAREENTTEKYDLANWFFLTVQWTDSFESPLKVFPYDFVFHFELSS